MKAYSEDLRERIVRAIEQGMAREEIVKVFAVSLASIKRYLKQDRETGTLAAKTIPGRPSKKLVALQLGVREQLETTPDATLEQQCEQWEERSGTRVSTATMSRAIRRIGWTRKKKRWEPVSEMKRSAAGGESR
jgi:transposase